MSASNWETYYRLRREADEAEMQAARMRAKYAALNAALDTAWRIYVAQITASNDALVWALKRDADTRRSN